MPEWSQELRRHLSRLRIDPAREMEIIEELSQHLEQRYEELLSDGLSEPEARRIAIQELVEPETLGAALDSLRQAHAAPPAPSARNPFGGLWQDLRFAARSLRKQPGFAATAILTIALGIGVNSAIFALVDATLLRPLPIPEPHRAVAMWESTPTSDREGVSPLNLMDWEKRSRSIERIGGFVPYVGGMVMSGNEGLAETLSRQWVTSGFFEALGVEAIAGRTFRVEDDRNGAEVVVLSEGIWRSRFNADPSIVGSTIHLDGTPHTVVGVAPQESQLLGQTNIWVMVAIEGAPPRARAAHPFVTVGRLAPDATIESARAELSAVANALAEEYPETNRGRGVTIQALRDRVIGSDLRLTSTIFLGVVGFVLLVCCANVANLMLARATVRSRELAIRMALGAGRFRVVRQLLTESLLLSAIGGILGVALGAIILEIAPVLIPQGMLPEAIELVFDLRILAFCAAAALFAGVLFGIAPAWQASMSPSAEAIAASGRAVTGRGGNLRSLIVVGEVATAVLLLFGAGLLLRTLMAVDDFDRGYRAEQVLTMIVDPLGSRYPTRTSLLQFFEAVEDEVLAVPGVGGVAWVSTLPLGTSYAGETYFEIAGDTPASRNERPTADYQIVSPSYFTALELPVLEGRAFTEHDTHESLPVCIVNEAFVRGFLNGRSPIGTRVTLQETGSPNAPSTIRQIVGVAKQVKGRPDETKEMIQIYVPMAQDAMDDMFLAVRSESGPASKLAPAVRAAIGRIDKEQLVSVRSVMTLQDIESEATSRHRFRAVLVMAFAGLALLLAMVGVFGILAYSVQQRVRDFGVRRALGATAADVFRLVLVSAARVVAIGTVIGLVLAIALGRTLTSVLFGVEALDPVTFAAVLLVLVVTAALSSAGPAWRATRVDPSIALRGE